MATEIKIADKPTLDDARQHASNASAYSLACLNAVGDVGNAANANGTIHAKISNLNNNVGSNADASNTAGSIHAKLKDIKSSLPSQSVIKSIQRGVTTIDSSITLVNVSISAVNLAKAYVLVSYDINYYEATNRIPRANLTSNANLELKVGGTGGVTTVAWEVIEYN